ncbi:MAG: hypothetical protein H6810_04685 [Phycisphaeraceae bacterium]|nr:MAG: hypothetical protein H6810_04685 [Phycisphaeraceae bacterium]
MKRCALACGLFCAVFASAGYGQVIVSGKAEPVASQRGPIDQAPRATVLGTGFTYQGRLEDGGSPATGSYDLKFTLYDDLGVLVAGPICRDNVAVTGGLFTADLDFGFVFNGDQRRLEIAVRPGGAAGNCDVGGGYTTLSPRQALNPAPYAMGLRLPYSGARSNPGASVFSIMNTYTSGSSSGLLGVQEGPATFNFSDAAGVRGESISSIGAGVLGLSDTYVGVLGYSFGDGATGTFGRSDGIGGSGVRGWATGESSYAINGYASGANSWAGYFTGRGYFSDRVGIGITSPATALDVAGTTRTTGLQMTTGAAAGRVMTSDAAGNASWVTPASNSTFATYVNGNTTAPTVNTQFLTPTATVTITAGQKIYVSANAAFGSTIAGGADNLDIFIGYRVSGSGATPTTVGGGIFNLRVQQNTRVPMGISAVISNLVAGTYDVGMVGDDDGNGNWNNNEWGYVSVIVLN